MLTMISDQVRLPGARNGRRDGGWVIWLARGQMKIVSTKFRDANAPADRPSGPVKSDNAWQCRSREGGNPANAGRWIPAYAGKTLN
jgi:hypothetical protein